MSGIRIKDATPIEELQDHLLFAVGNTEGDTDGCVSLGQVKDFVDNDKAAVCFTGDYNDLENKPNLNNYVQVTTLNQNYYNKQQVNSLIHDMNGITYKVVDELPEKGEPNIIYLMLHENTAGGDLEWHESLEDPVSSGDDDVYDEYVWLVDGETFERIGSTAINFSNYYDKEEVDAMIPSVGNGTITITQEGVTKGTFTTNQSGNTTIALDGQEFTQEQADWNESDVTDPAYIKNKPSIPTVNDTEITFTQGGVLKGSISLNQSTAETVELDGHEQADWTVEDPNDPSFINNKPDTLSLILEYSDDTVEVVDFYIAQKSNLSNYMYIQNIYNGQNTITLTTTQTGSPSASNHASKVEYSKNRTDWTTLNLTAGGTNTIVMEKGESVYFRQSAKAAWNFKSSTASWITKFTASQKHNVGGNANSLYGGHDGLTNTKTGVFAELFNGDVKLVDASNLVLCEADHTNLSYELYGCFNGCSGLLKAPELPATTVATSCYQSCFEGCSSLLNAPELPATNLAESCYNSCFKNCSSILYQPELPVKTLAISCYQSCFEGCSSLLKAEELPAKTLVGSCYKNMYSGCSSLVLPPAIYGITLAEGCFESMFSGCRNLIATPVLRANTLAEKSYKSMFNGCSSLDNVTIFADDISASNCLDGWLSGVAQSGEFHNNGSAVYTTSSASGIPSGWTDVQPDDDYLYIRNTYNGTNTISAVTQKLGVAEPQAGTYATSVEVSTDKTNWSTMTFDLTTPPTITIAAGQTLYLRNDTGVFNTYNNSNNFYWLRTSFVGSQECIVGGNPSSLLDYSNTSTVTIPKGAFSRLFAGSNGVVDGSRLTMTSSPTEFCLSYVFRDCPNLVAGPVFNTSVAKEFFEGFFWNCTGLKTSSELPATTLADICYQDMYYGCSNLVNAPELPATTLVRASYSQMFWNCTSLSELVVYADDISAYSCINEWLYGVAPTGTFHNLGSATYPSGISGIPTGWTETNS